MCLVSGGQELSGGAVWSVDILASSAEIKNRLIAALRALQPAEPTEEEVERAQGAALDAFREAWHDRPVDDAGIWRGVVLAVVAAMRGGR